MHRESWVQRHRNGFESCEARVRKMWTTKQKREGKGRHCRALQKNSDWVCDSKEKEGIPKKELVHIYLL